MLPPLLQYPRVIVFKLYNLIGVRMKIVLVGRSLFTGFIFSFLLLSASPNQAHASGCCEKESYGGTWMKNLFNQWECMKAEKGAQARTITTSCAIYTGATYFPKDCPTLPYGDISNCLKTQHEGEPCEYATFEFYSDNSPYEKFTCEPIAGNSKQKSCVSHTGSSSNF